MADTPNQYGIQASGEKTRSPEFKTARDELVKTINSWLNEQAKNKTNLSDENLITETSLGPVNNRVNMIGVSYREGTSLRGDNTDSRLEFQRITQDKSGGLEIIHVSGTDPVASMVRGDEYKPGYKTEKVATFGVESHGSNGLEGYFRYEFGGDGSVSQHFVTQKGMHTGRNLHSARDIELATSAFEQVVAVATI